MSEENNGIINDPSAKIETIKNLLFGENIQAYNSEFEMVKSEIKQKKDELDSYIHEVRSELMQSIDSLATDINIRVTELENTLNDKTNELSEKKVDKKTLGKLLISLGDKIIAE